MAQWIQCNSQKGELTSNQQRFRIWYLSVLKIFEYHHVFMRKSFLQPVELHPVNILSARFHQSKYLGTK